MTSMSDTPPAPNPVLTAYENFVRETPFVTRFVISSQAVTWLLSLFVDVSFAVANIPHFTVFKFEIYRILLSPFICPGFLSLVFAYISFVDNGRRLEYSMGSASFGALLLTLGTLTNLCHLLVCFTLCGITGKQTYLFLPALGTWIILFSVISIDCAKAPPNSMRKLVFLTVPTIYYPLALFTLFSLLGGFQLSYLLSIGVGYACGLGYLDRLKIGESRCQQWEEAALENFTRQEGWIASQSATGSASWTEDSHLISRLTGQQDRRIGGGNPERGEAGAAGSSFPNGGGRQLGTAERRHTSDPREARLQALESGRIRAGAIGRNATAM